MRGGPARALVRPPGATYPEALTRNESRAPVDVALARRQHAEYVAALAGLGLDVEQLPADDTHPDAVFVQDPVAVLGGRAIVGSPAMESRRGEADDLVAALSRFFPVVELSPPAFLDWGDVLVADGEIFVGQSERSNAAAVERLREILGPGRAIEGVAVPSDLLHLLSGCSYLGERTVLAVASLRDFVRSRGFHVLPVPESEAAAANVLTIGRDVIMPAGYPETSARIEEAGFRVHPVAIHEFEKRDGGVTCLSILY